MRIAGTAAFALSLLAAGSAAAAQQVPVKTYFQPRSTQEIRAENAAKAEREALVRLASDETHRRHEEAFAKVDADRNGRIDLQEFKEAQVHLDRTNPTKTP